MTRDHPACTRAMSQDYSTEQWRPVVGYEGLYEVSDHGRVRSVDRVHTRKNHNGVHRVHLKGKMLSQHQNSRTRYMQVSLCSQRTGRCVKCKVQLLVLTAFVGPKGDAYGCRHLDGDHTNNCLVNLAWGTQSENEKDKLKTGTDNSGSKHALAKLTAEKVLAIRRDPRSSIAIGDTYGVSRQCVRNIKARRRWAWL